MLILCLSYFITTVTIWFFQRWNLKSHNQHYYAKLPTRHMISVKSCILYFVQQWLMFSMQKIIQKSAMMYYKFLLLRPTKVHQSF